MFSYSLLLTYLEILYCLNGFSVFKNFISFNKLDNRLGTLKVNCSVCCQWSTACYDSFILKSKNSPKNSEFQREQSEIIWFNHVTSIEVEKVWVSFPMWDMKVCSFHRGTRTKFKIAEKYCYSEECLCSCTIYFDYASFLTNLLVLNKIVTIINVKATWTRVQTPFNQRSG